MRRLRGRHQVLSRAQRATAALAVLSLGLNLFHLYQIKVASTRAPRFSRGGEFVRPSVPGLPLPSPGPGGATAPPLPVPTAGATPSPTRSSGRVVSPPRTPTPPPAQAPAAQAGTLPALGTYLYAVSGPDGSGSGTEQSPFGSRNYPSQLTLVAHRRDPKLASDEVVFDIHFPYPEGSGSSHDEREIVSFRPDGIYFTFESGVVAFSGFSQTSQASYRPPMLQVPLPLAVGQSRSGRSEAVAPDGSVARVERWTVRVAGREALTVLGRSTDTWVVTIHRETEGGGLTSERIQYRDRTYWYDPLLRLWVRWREDFQGERVNFTYETHYLATLVGFQPA